MGNITNKNLQRMKELMGGIKPITESVNPSSIELTKKSPNGKYYSIVRETKKYYIKESTDGVNFDYIGGLANKGKNQFDSYENATRRLNIMFEDFNRSYGITEGTDILTPDLIQEKKFVIKTKKKKSEDSGEATGFDFGGEDTTDTEEESSSDEFDFGGDETDTEEGGDEFDFGGDDTEESSDEGGDEFDFGGDETDTEEETTDTEIIDDENDEDLDLEDDSEDNIKDIQKLTGKLGQKIRDTEDLSSDTMKWVAKSVISALDLDIMDSEDKKDIIRAVKKKSKEDSDAEFDFMGEDPEDEDDDNDWHPHETFRHDEIADWNMLSDEEKSAIANREDYMDDEEELYGPGNGDIEGSEVILDDEEMSPPMNTDDYRDQPGYIGVDYMSSFSKNVKRSLKTQGKSLDQHEVDIHLRKIKSKVGGDIDNNAVVGNFGYVEVTPSGYMLHKEGSKFGKKFGFDELGKLQKEISSIDHMDYMEDPYMMPKTAPSRPTTKPDTKPGTDKPSPSKRPFTPPPHIRPGEEPAPKAEYEDDFYGVNYDNDDTVDYMGMPSEEFIASADGGKTWYDPEDQQFDGDINNYYKVENIDNWDDFTKHRVAKKQKWYALGRGLNDGNHWFDRYVEKNGPMIIRSRNGWDADETSEMFDDYMSDDLDQYLMDVDNSVDFDEYSYENDLTMNNPKTAPSRPTTKPDTKPGTDKPTPSKRPFTPPPHIRPGEEPAPKARGNRY